MNWQFLPNAICVVRIALVAPVVLAIAARHYPLALTLFCVAAGSDALDGFLARRYGWLTPLGRVLDPAADKLLMIAVLVTLAAAARVPVWLCVTAVARDVTIALGALAYRRVSGGWGGGATGASKLNTVLAAGYTAAVLTLAAHPQLVPPWLVPALGAALFVATVATGIDYVLTYARRAAAGT